MGYTIEEENTKKSLIITDSVMTISTDSTRTNYDLSFAQSISISERSLNSTLYMFPIVGVLSLLFAGFSYQQSLLTSGTLIPSIFTALGIGLILLTIYAYVTKTDGPEITITFTDGTRIQFILVDGNQEDLTSAFRESALTTRSGVSNENN